LIDFKFVLSDLTSVWTIGSISWDVSGFPYSLFDYSFQLFGYKSKWKERNVKKKKKYNKL